MDWGSAKCTDPVKFNMAGDSNSRKVRAACLLSIFFVKNLFKNNYFIYSSLLDYHHAP